MQDFFDISGVKIVDDRFLGIREEEMVKHGTEVEPLAAVAQVDSRVDLARLDVSSCDGLPEQCSPSRAAALPGLPLPARCASPLDPAPCSGRSST